MFNIQEIEEQQYNIGLATEHQNAFALSMMEREPDDPKIAEEMAKGKFVVVSISERYCPCPDVLADAA